MQFVHLDDSDLLANCIDQSIEQFRRQASFFRPVEANEVVADYLFTYSRSLCERLKDGKSAIEKQLDTDDQIMCSLCNDNGCESHWWT